MAAAKRGKPSGTFFVDVKTAVGPFHFYPFSSPTYPMFRRGPVGLAPIAGR